MFNKKGQEGVQVNIFMVAFAVLIFFLVMGAGLGKFMSTGVGMAMDTGYLTGIEGFIVNYWMLWIILAFLLAVFWVTQR